MNHDRDAFQAATSRLPVVVLGIAYRSNSEALRLARQIMGNEAREKPYLVLVDNSEVSDLASVLSKTEREQCDLIVHVPGSNLGYFGGAASGLNMFLSNYKLPDWVIVCNVDLCLEGRDFFSRLIYYGASHGHAVIAPGITSNLSGNDQNPFMRSRPSNIRMNSYKALFKWYPLLCIYSAMHLAKQRLRKLKASSGVCPANPNTKPVPIYAAHGACIAFRKSYFEAGGTLQHGAFLFGEEIFVAETVRRLGLSIAYDPRLRVFHEEHKTTGQWPTRLMASYMEQAAVYCSDTFF